MGCCKNLQAERNALLYNIYLLYFQYKSNKIMPHIYIYVYVSLSFVISFTYNKLENSVCCPFIGPAVCGHVYI